MTGPATSARACRLCGETAGRVLLSGTDHRAGMGGWFSVLRCAGCGLARTDPWPEDPMAWYPDDYQPHAETFTARAVEAVIRRTATGLLPPLGRRAATALVPDADLGGMLERGATLLDVGAGNGTAVRALRAAGVDAHGVEPSALAVEAAHARGAPTVLAGTLDDNPQAGRAFEVVRMFQTLEHMPDPVDALRRARALLAPGGRVVVGVPNLGALGRRAFGASWNGLELPRHLHHFTRATLAAVMEAAGLRVASVRTVALFGLLTSSLDARTAGGRRQRGWGMSLPLRAAAYPVELAVAAAGAGDGLLAVARAEAEH